MLAGVRIRIGPYELLIEGTEEGCVYRRLRGDTVEKEVLIPNPRGKKLGLYPAPPVMGYPDITKHVLLRMPEPVVLSPGESVTFYAITPIDAIVNVETEGGWQTIDWFMPCRFKLSVYGTIDDGVLCRSYQTRLGRSLDAGDGEAIFKLTLRNQTKRPVALTKVVLPAEQMSLYYDGYTAYLENVSVSVRSSIEAEVDLLNEPPVPGLNKAPAVFKREEKRKWVMSYGY